MYFQIMHIVLKFQIFISIFTMVKLYNSDSISNNLRSQFRQRSRWKGINCIDKLAAPLIELAEQKESLKQATLIHYQKVR